MENNLENKSNFLQQISGIGVIMTCIAKTFQIEDRLLNGVLLNDKSEKTLYLNYKGLGDFYSIEEWQANLKPLSSITDEDAVYIANTESNFENAVSRGKSIIDFIFNVDGSAFNSHLTIKVVDYLRSKGYALPWMGLSVESMIEYGWIKLI